MSDAAQHILGLITQPASHAFKGAAELGGWQVLNRPSPGELLRRLFASRASVVVAEARPGDVEAMRLVGKVARSPHRPTLIAHAPWQDVLLEAELRAAGVQAYVAEASADELLQAVQRCVDQFGLEPQLEHVRLLADELVHPSR